MFLFFFCFTKDLAEFVEGSGDDGFIIFTLGSMVSKMPAEIAKQFLEAFRQIPQRVTIISISETGSGHLEACDLVLTLTLTLTSLFIINVYTLL